MEGESPKKEGESESKQPAKQSPLERAVIQPAEPPQSESAAQPTGDKSKKRCWRDKRWRHPQVIVNGALAFIAVIAAIIYFCQLQQMKHQLTIDQRAWVAVYAVEGFPEADKEFVVKTTIRNTGKTFAKHYKGFIRPEAFRPGQGRHPDFSVEENAPTAKPPEVSIGLLPPNGEYSGTLNVKENHEKVTPDEIKAVKSGEVILLIHGRIDYDDIFGCHHWTTFCYRLNSAITAYSAYESHNDADDNPCP